MSVKRIVSYLIEIKGNIPERIGYIGFIVDTTYLLALDRIFGAKCSALWCSEDDQDYSCVNTHTGFMATGHQFCRYLIW